MKKISITFLSLAIVLSLTACNGQNTDTESSSMNTDTQNKESSFMSENTEDSVNQAKVQVGVYTGSATYTQDEFSMTWNIIVDFKEDNTFVLYNEKGEEKGAGTYELTDAGYTMKYSDDRSTTFVIQEDDSLKMTEALPFGSAGIDLDKVGDIILNYYGDSYEFTIPEMDSN